MMRRGTKIIVATFAAGMFLSVSFALGQGQKPAEGKSAGAASQSKGQAGADKPEADGGAGGPSFQFRGRPGDLTTLLREAPVRKELKLTKKQSDQLKEAMSELDARRREMLQGAMPPPPGPGGEPPGAKRQIVATGNDPIAGESEQAIAEILEPKQMTRLRQIGLQQEGLMAVSRDEIADKINLSIPQREAIAAILDDMRQAQQELMRSVTGGSGAFLVQAKGKDKDGRPKLDEDTLSRMQKMQKGREQIRKSALQQINKLLTKKQGANFTRLMGEPFDFKELSPTAQGKPLFSLETLAGDAAKPGTKDAGKAAKDEPSAKDDAPALSPRRQGRSLREPANRDH